MPTINGHVYYTPMNNLTPNLGIPNVPVALRDITTLNGAIVLTDSNGLFTFNNVPNGTYQLIETWGTPGGIVSPVNYPTALIPMVIAPAEVEPPLSSITVTPPVLADMLMAISPNLLNLIVTGDLNDQDFYDAPVGSKPLVFNSVMMVGPNLITAAANGSFGSLPAGSLVNTIPATAPYPATTPGLPYQAAPEITDGHYSIVNIRRRVNTTFGWWNLSDHETMLETGRFMFVNGDFPGAVLFTDTIAVTPNTFYTFTGWGLNLLNNNGTPPRFSIKVIGSDGSTLGYQLFNSLNFTPIPVWYQGGFLFNSGVFDSVSVEVISEAPASLVGNDYAIDELRMFQTEIIDVLKLEKTMNPTTIYSSTSGAGQNVTMTVIVTNFSNTITAPDVVFQDVLDPQLQFVAGSVSIDAIPVITANPNAGFSLGNMAPGSSRTIVFHAITLVSGPTTIPNMAQASYDVAVNGNGDTIRNTVISNTTRLDIFINVAKVLVVKTVSKAYAQVGDTLTYTITLNNNGTVSANDVVITDAIPPGTTFVDTSLTGASGTPPTLTLSNPLPAGGSAVISYRVLIGAVVPNQNPVKNSATVAYVYTIDPANPNGVSAMSSSNIVTTQINSARLVITKRVDKHISYIGDTITYQITIKNLGNTDADNVVLTDLLANGVSYITNSLIVSVSYSGSLATNLILTNSITAGQIISISFKVKVSSMPNPNPVLNQAILNYAFTIDPEFPDAIQVTTSSNIVDTIIFRYPFNQQITDIINSVASKQAALSAIANAEGSKIQKMVSINDISVQDMLCLNKSVADMMNSIAMLEAILKQKLSIVDCQISGPCE